MTSLTPSITLLFCCAILLLHDVDCTVTITLKFLKYNNSDGRAANGHCCDGKWGLCQGNGCDTKFTFCLHSEIELNNYFKSREHCDLYRTVTDTFENHNKIRFEDFNNRPGFRFENPVVLRGISMPAELLLKVDVVDNDDFSGNEPIEYLRLELFFWEIKHAMAPDGYNVTASRRTSLSLNIKITCDDHFYGEDCDIYCRPPGPDSDEHYTCDTEAGEKICDDGWQGPRCDQIAVGRCNLLCLNGGSCFLDGIGQSLCSCPAYYVGDVCQTLACDEFCSPGKCVMMDDVGPAAYSCVCPDGYESSDYYWDADYSAGQETCIEMTSLPAEPPPLPTAETSYRVELHPHVVWVDRPNADCDALAENGQQYIDGVYGVHPAQSEPFNVYCDMSDRGWTVIQRHVDDSEDFNREWIDYKYGFGELSERSSFWLGLEYIYYLTNQRRYKLLITLQKGDGSYVYAEYRDFRVGSERDDYRLYVNGYSGNAGDALNWDADGTQAPHNGSPFSTADEDNDDWADGNCAEMNRSGWWFTACYKANLNGPYIEAPNGWPRCSSRGCIAWETIDQIGDYALLKSEMKILPNGLDSSV